jgi:hypothetical protein
MISSLDAIARESDLAGDDKEQLNAHVMIVGECCIHILLFKNSREKQWLTVGFTRKHAPLLPRTASTQDSSARSMGQTCKDSVRKQS